MSTKKIELTDPEFLTTDRIEIDTVEEEPTWFDDTDLELVDEQTVLGSTAHVSPEANAIFEHLREAGVKARTYGAEATKPGADRRRDLASARRFDRALALLTTGDIDAAFYAFSEILEAWPESTRLWLFVRAVASAR